jgi:predicted permease
MGNLLQDLRYALRTLARAPGFTAVAILTLALGIGANTAIFSLVHAVILKPLPFHDPARLITIWDTYLPQYDKLGISPLELDTWSSQTDLFDQTAWYRYVSQDLDLIVPGAEALEVHAGIVSTGLLPMLGVAPALGRGFTASEDPHSALLSHRLWQTHFGGNPAIAGRTVRLNDQEFTIVGVLPPDFQFPDWADLWLPPGPLLADQLTNPVRHALGFVARLRPGVTLQQAEARLNPISQRLAAAYPKTSQGWRFRLIGLQEDLTANVRPALLLLLGAVALVLLIACGNVANLLLSRATARSKEIAVRTALGASSWRIARQLMTESLVLAWLGGALGLVAGQWSLAVFSPVRAPLDVTVLLFLVAVSLSTAIVFGLAPALHATRNDPGSVIKSGASTGAGTARLRGALVVLEFALALVLVVGEGILVKSFLHLMHVDPGFDPQQVLTLRISIPPSRKPDALFHRIEERLRTLAGVESIAAANTLPLIATRANSTRFNVPGSPLIDPNALPAAQIRAVSPDYFRAMRIPMRSGRPFHESETNDPVVIVNETLARRYWPGRDPVGLKFVTGPWGPNPSWSTVVGVAGDVKQFGLDSEPSLDLYFPSLIPTYLVVKTAQDPLLLAAAVRRITHEIDPDLAISEVQTMEQVLAKSARSRRWTMALLGVFAALALVLALVGIYGVMSWSVSLRTREIGIRMALGARSGHVLGAVIRSGLKLSAMGLVVGTAGAFALRGVLAGLVFGVSTADPLIYGSVALLMLAVAILACYLPARRASRVDPLIALRWE